MRAHLPTNNPVQRHSPREDPHLAPKPREATRQPAPTEASKKKQTVVPDEISKKGIFADHAQEGARRSLDGKRAFGYGGKLFIIKPTKEELAVLQQQNFIFHYSGHNEPLTEAEMAGLDEFQREKLSSPSPVVILQTDEEVDKMFKGKQITRLPGAQKEAEEINYFGNYVIRVKNEAGELETTPFVVSMPVDAIEKLTNSEVKIDILLHQADTFWANKHISARYKALDEEKKADFIENLKKTLREERDAFIPPGQRYIMFTGKPSEKQMAAVQKILLARDKANFRQTVVVNGDLGVLTW